MKLYFIQVQVQKFKHIDLKFTLLFRNVINFIIELEEEIYSIEIVPNRNPLIAEIKYVYL